jgi:hypothetical protein
MGQALEHHQALAIACRYCFHADIYRRVELYPEFLVEAVCNGPSHQGSSDHEPFKGLTLPRSKPRRIQARSAARDSEEVRRSVPTLPDPTRTNAFLLGKLLNGIGLEGIENFFLR